MIKVYGWKQEKAGQKWDEILKTRDARKAKALFDKLSSSEVVLVQGKSRQVLASKNNPNTKAQRVRLASVKGVWR